MLSFLPRESLLLDARFAVTRVWYRPGDIERKCLREGKKGGKDKEPTRPCTSMCSVIEIIGREREKEEKDVELVFRVFSFQTFFEYRSRRSQRQRGNKLRRNDANERGESRLFVFARLVNTASRVSTHVRRADTIHRFSTDICGRSRAKVSARAFPGFNSAFFSVSFSLDFQRISTRHEIAQLGSRRKRPSRAFTRRRLLASDEFLQLRVRPSRDESSGRDSRTRRNKEQKLKHA